MKIADAAHEKALQKEKPEEEKTKVVKEYMLGTRMQEEVVEAEVVGVYLFQRVFFCLKLNLNSRRL